jgi:hypothetical protein
MGGGGNDVVKSTNTYEIQILSAGYQKPGKTGKVFADMYKYIHGFKKNTLIHHCRIVWLLIAESLLKCFKNV